MATRKLGQAQGADRHEAAKLLRERHEHEAELLAELMAAVSRRASAQIVVETETEQIKSRLADMSRLGFDEATLVGLGIDVADVGAGRPPRKRDRPDPVAKVGAGEVAAHVMPNAVPPRVKSSPEAPVAVRTTAHLASILPVGMAVRP